MAKRENKTPSGALQSWDKPPRKGKNKIKKQASRAGRIVGKRDAIVGYEEYLNEEK